MNEWNTRLNKISGENTDDLCRAFLALRNVTEVRKFLGDLLTEEEVLEFGKRWQTARMLYQGVPYTSIVTETGLSSTTVARVSKWLQKGVGGYRLLLDRMHHSHTPLSVGRGLRSQMFH